MFKRNLTSILFLGFIFIAFSLMGVPLTEEAKAVPSRHLADLNWMQVQEIVPLKIDTVILSVGTLEAHGVTKSLTPYPGLYSPDKVTATPIDPSYPTFPSPSSILLYTPGEGYPEFNLERAREYLNKVADKLVKLIRETIAKWDKAGL